jgi:Leucine-rich repeat (LRR) protein
MPSSRLQEIQELEHLLVAGNQISKIERDAVPKALKHVHLGINKLSSLNGALRDLDDLEWIFINSNNLKSIDNELPIVSVVPISIMYIFLTHMVYGTTNKNSSSLFLPWML